AGRSGDVVACGLADTPGGGVLRALRPPARGLLHVLPEGPDDVRAPLRLAERLDRPPHAVAQRAGAPGTAAGTCLQVNLPANLAARILGRVDVDVRPTIVQRLHEILGHGQRGGASREVVLVEGDPDRPRHTRGRLMDVRGERGTGQVHHGDGVRDGLVRLLVLLGRAPAGPGHRPV